MVSCVFVIVQVMAIKISLSFWLAALVMVTQIHGETWPLILTDVGNYDDLNTGPLNTDLRNGANPDTTGPNGWTALHIAAGLNKPNMAAALRDKGANLNIKDSSSHTPLHVAAGLHRVDVIDTLLPSADTEVKGPNQWTALHVAAESDFNDVTFLLMMNSADPNAADSNGWTPLHIAVGTGHQGNVEAILSPFGENYRGLV
jgi:ankyrin repeat protein